MARKIFEQQAMAIGRLFTVAANFTDPDVYFIGGGVIEAAPRLPRLVPRRGRTPHPAPRRAAPGGHDRARPRPRHGRLPRLGDRRPQHPRPTRCRPRDAVHTERNVTLMRGPVVTRTLGTVCSQSCWQAPPITNRSPLPRFHDSEAPPPRGRSRSGRGAPRLTIAMTGLVTMWRWRSPCHATESLPSRYRLNPIESNGSA